MAITGIPDAFTSVTTDSMKPLDRRVQPGPENRVDDQRAVADLGEVQLPGLAVGDLHDGQAEAAESRG